MHDVRSLPSFPLRHRGVWCTKTQILYLQAVVCLVYTIAARSQSTHRICSNTATAELTTGMVMPQVCLVCSSLLAWQCDCELSSSKSSRSGCPRSADTALKPYLTLSRSGMGHFKLPSWSSSSSLVPDSLFSFGGGGKQCLDTRWPIFLIDVGSSPALQPGWRLQTLLSFVELIEFWPIIVIMACHILFAS